MVWTDLTRFFVGSPEEKLMLVVHVRLHCRDANHRVTYQSWANPKGGATVTDDLGNVYRPVQLSPRYGGFINTHGGPPDPGAEVENDQEWLYPDQDLTDQIVFDTPSRALKRRWFRHLSAGTMG
jgi:hypothetical protein